MSSLRFLALAALTATIALSSVTAQAAAHYRHHYVHHHHHLIAHHN